MTTARKVIALELDFKTVMLTIIAIAQLGNSYLIWRTQQDVKVVHVATNSMKDALVKASRAEGNLEGRSELKEERNNR